MTWSRVHVALLAGLGALAVPALIVFARERGTPHHEGATHHGVGVPLQIVSDRRVGPYMASVWADAVLGTSPVYAVLRARDGASFTAPASVRIAVAPASGRLAEVVYETHPEHTSKGARYMADVAFDRPERWNVRVIVEGAAGGGELASQVEAEAGASHGLPGLVISSLPFLLVAGLWWRRSVVRNRMLARNVAAGPQRGAGAAVESR